MSLSDPIAAGEDWLAHHGILGMHWGHRKAEVAPLSKDQQIANLNKKDHFNGNRIYEGAGLTNYQKIKLNKKLAKKSLTYADLTPDQKASYTKTTTLNAYSASGKHALTALILGGAATVLVRSLPLSPQVKQGAYVLTAFVAGSQALTNLSEIKSIHQSTAKDRIEAQRRVILKQK
jgi:hypothetical protein